MVSVDPTRPSPHGPICQPTGEDDPLSDCILTTYAAAIKVLKTIPCSDSDARLGSISRLSATFATSARSVGGRPVLIEQILAATGYDVALMLAVQPDVPRSVQHGAQRVVLKYMLQCAVLQAVSPHSGVDWEQAAVDATCHVLHAAKQGQFRPLGDRQARAFLRRNLRWCLTSREKSSGRATSLPHGVPGAAVCATQCAAGVAGDLHAALARLSASEREALILRKYVQLSNREIAQMQCVPVETVRSRIKSALCKLRRILEADQHAT
jgi:hypothetical protein